MKKLSRFILVAFILCFLSTGASYAISIEISDFATGHTLLDFDELLHKTVMDDEYKDLGVVFTGTQGLEGQGNAETLFAYTSGGSHSGPNYIGLSDNRWDGSVILSFDNPVYQVGGILVEKRSWLSAYDRDGDLIETVNWAHSGDVFDDFVGIDSGDVEIATAIFSGDFYAVDDVRFTSGSSSSAPVPEPGTLFLVGVGILGIFGVGRKKNRR